MTDRVAIVHDYLTQRGGAERVVLSMTKAFPGAAVYTSLYDADRTFPEFSSVDVRTLGVDRLALFRRHHRLAFPLLAPSFSHLYVAADVVLCSSSGWAHGVHGQGRKVVYCHTPARWLYPTGHNAQSVPPSIRWLLDLMSPALRTWDRRAMASADRHMVNSMETQRRVEKQYGIASQIVHPGYGLDPVGERSLVPSVAPGFFLLVSRLLPYKNVGVVVDAFRQLPGQRLVVVGDGPEAKRVRASGGPNVRFLPVVNDAELRGLYEGCTAVVAAAYEDYGLTPLEAAAFGKPAVVLRWGGFLDTIREGETGVFFDVAEVGAIVAGIATFQTKEWDSRALIAHAEKNSERAFIAALQAIVAEELDLRGPSAVSGGSPEGTLPRPR